MVISNITPPQVWSASQRSLTNIGSSALAATSTVNTAVAGAGSVDLRPLNGVVSLGTVLVVTGAGATSAISIQLFDGANHNILATTAAAAGSAAGFSGFGTVGVGLSLFNADATHAGTYMVGQFSLTI